MFGSTSVLGVFMIVISRQLVCIVYYSSYVCFVSTANSFGFNKAQWHNDDSSQLFSLHKSSIHGRKINAVIAGNTRMWWLDNTCSSVEVLNRSSYEVSLAIRLWRTMWIILIRHSLQAKCHTRNNIQFLNTTTLELNETWRTAISTFSSLSCGGSPNPKDTWENLWQKPCFLEMRVSGWDRLLS